MFEAIRNRLLVTRLVFFLGAAVGILSIGGAALYGATFSSANVWQAFLTTFVPCAALWALFCYAAYQGFSSRNPILKCVFWLYVVFNVFVFPVGTAIAGVSVWLWRERRMGSGGPDPA